MNINDCISAVRQILGGRSLFRLSIAVSSRRYLRLSGAVVAKPQKNRQFRASRFRVEEAPNFERPFSNLFHFRTCARKSSVES